MLQMLLLDCTFQKAISGLWFPKEKAFKKNKRYKPMDFFQISILRK